VAVVVSAEPARGFCAWPSPRLVDRFTVWKDGSVAIWLEPHGARVLTDREDRGDRPWVPPPPKPRPRPVSNLPMAPVAPRPSGMAAGSGVNRAWTGGEAAGGTNSPDQ
jgi:competence protein ComEC